MKTIEIYVKRMNIVMSTRQRIAKRAQTNHTTDMLSLLRIARVTLGCTNHVVKGIDQSD